MIRYMFAVAAAFALTLPALAQDEGDLLKRLERLERIEAARALVRPVLPEVLEPDPADRIEPEILITYPPDGAVYAPDQTANLAFSLRVPPEMNHHKTEITVTIGDGHETRYLSSETLTAWEATVHPNLALPLAGLTPGKYVVTVFASMEDGNFQDTASIVLREPPVISLEPVLLQAADDGLDATFAASITGADDTGIRRVAWTIGQGGPTVITEEPVLKYRFPKTPLPYDLSVGIFDRSGLETTETFNFDLTERDIAFFQQQDGNGDGDKPVLKKPAPEAARTCGCKSMVIKTKAKSGIYCAKPPAAGQIPWEDQILCRKVAAPKPNPCAAGETPYECPLGRLAPEFLPPMKPGGGFNMANLHKARLSFGFEVEAVLQPKSNAKLCREGQFVQSTILLGGRPARNGNSQNAPNIDTAGKVTLPVKGGGNFVLSVIPAGQVVPANGARTFGRDDYAAPSETKRYHGNKKITWFDRPRSGIVMPRPPAGGIVQVYQSANVANEFISVVSGTTGTCWCRFSLDNQWNFFNAKTTGAGLALSKAMPNQLNCTIR